MPGGWIDAIRDYTLWLAASGATIGTIRLRQHYLTQLAARIPNGPWAATADDLVALLATPHWSPETRKSARSSIRGFYTWAVEAGRVPYDPSRKLPSVRVPPGQPRPAPLNVVAAALATADRRGQLMILLAVRAGLRRAEIARVHTRDLAPDLVGWSLRVVGKGGRVRVVPLHPHLEQLIVLPAGWVFPGGDDGHLSPDRVGRLLAAMLGPGWTGHCLRHAFASNAYAVERDLEAVRVLLGHSKPETTVR